MNTSRGIKAAKSKAPPSGAEFGPLAQAVNHIGNYVDGLRERMRLLEAVIENFPGGISLFDRDFRMVLCNEQQKTLLEYPEHLFSSGYPTMEELFRFNARRGEYGPGDTEEQVSRRMALIREQKAHVYDRARPNGTVLEVRGAPIAGGGFVTTYLDVTEQRRNQALIAHLAHHDSLTDLPNRTLFSDRLQNALAMTKRGALFAVHYLDIDGFKPVNDRIGHTGGDALLVAVAARLLALVRENDTVARLGGDEFAIVQTGITKTTDAAVLAERVIRAFHAPFSISGAEVGVSISIGVALAPRDGSTSDALLLNADGALYRSKARGKGVVTFHQDKEGDAAA